MEEKHLHIVCLDVPYPVDYGGVFDLFHKIRALFEAGIRIHLHCFEYGRGPQPVLDDYCVDVQYYSRREGHKGFSHKLPYIVCSRSSERLLENLARDDNPILLEGIHCTYLLNDPRFDRRRVLLRLHNVEYLYYRQLYHAERSLLKKLYFLHESNLLHRYEKKVANQVPILAVSDHDKEIYQREFGAARIETIPVFLPFDSVRGREGTGCFCLYHGNLSVAENEQAAVWLLKEVFCGLSAPLIICGRQPSARLCRLVDKHPQACLIADPTQEEMQDLIAKAQIHVLPSFNCTGVKLKLLNALYNGRHCVINEEAVRGTGLEPACHTGDSAEEFRQLIGSLYKEPFTADEAESRKEMLCGSFDNRANAAKLIRAIW